MMKKYSKCLSLIVLSFLFIANTLTSTVHAQDWQAFLENTNKATQTIPSMAGQGDVAFSFIQNNEEQVSGKFTFDFKYNVEPRFSTEAKIDGNVKFVQNEYDDEWNITGTKMEEQAVNALVTVVDGILYAHDGSTWTVEDFTEMEQEVTQQFDRAFEEAHYQNFEITDDVIAFYQKYYDLVEDDTNYVLTMKKVIDATQFWTELETSTGQPIEAMQQEALDQAITAIEEVDQPISEEERKIYSDRYERILDYFLTQMQEITVSYNKENFMISGVTAKLKLTEQDIIKLMGDFTSEEMEEMEQMAINFDINLKFNEHGNKFDIKVPANAPTFRNSTAETESTESVVEESAE